MNVSRLMTRTPVTVDVADSLDKAICLMEEHCVHHLPVVQGSRPVGMLSDRDLLLAVGWKLGGERKLRLSARGVAGPVRVDQVMSTPVVAVTPDTSLQVVARTLMDHRINAVIVARRGSLLGIVTTYDLLASVRDIRHLASTSTLFDEAVERHMRYKVITVGPKYPIESVASLMAEKHIRHVPIVAGDILIGIVSDRDFRRKYGVEMVEDEQAQEIGACYVPASTVMDIMTKDVRTVPPVAAVADAAATMADRRIGALPVLQDEKVVGIITDTDVVRLIARLET